MLGLLARLDPLARLFTGQAERRGAQQRTPFAITLGRLRMPKKFTKFPQQDYAQCV